MKRDTISMFLTDNLTWLALTSYRQIAIDVLRAQGKPLHYKKILELAMKDGFKPNSSAKTPDATLNARIAAEIKHDPDSPFVKSGKGIYGLRKEVQPEPRGWTSKQPISKQRSKDNRIVGKAGEHVVMGEMMFRGFNAHIPLVDKGIDIVVIKGNVVSYIQVKTANKNMDVYNHSIKVKSYNETAGRDTFYVFVLRDNDECMFVILSYADMRKHIDSNDIKITKNDYYAVRFMYHNGAIRLGRRDGPSMQDHVNDWDILM